MFLQHAFCVPHLSLRQLICRLFVHQLLGHGRSWRPPCWSNAAQIRNHSRFKDPAGGYSNMHALTVYHRRLLSCTLQHSRVFRCGGTMGPKESGYTRSWHCEKFKWSCCKGRENNPREEPVSVKGFETAKESCNGRLDLMVIQWHCGCNPTCIRTLVHSKGGS
jgi:hypothetical protein